MKNIYKLLTILLFISLILPNLVFASWWNPTSWNIYKYLFIRPIKTENVIVSTSTVKTVASTTNSNNVDKPVIDNSAIIKAQVDAQVKAVLKAKAIEDSKIIQQKIDDQAKIDAAVKAVLDKQKADQDIVKQAIIEAQDEKQKKLDSINLQIAQLNLKYSQDIARAKKEASMSSMNVQAAAGETFLLIDKINTQYNIDYDALVAQYQAFLSSN